MQKLFASFLAILVLLAASPAPAAYVYQYVFEQSNYTLNTGATVAIPVYLQETVSGGDTPWFTAANRGLFSGGVRVFFNVPPIPTDNAEVLSVANIVVNPQFTDPVKTTNLNPGISAGLIGAVTSPTTQLIQGTTVNASSSRILLGTFTFTAGLIPGEVTNLRAEDFNVSQPGQNENTVFNSSNFDSLDLDSLILSGTASITVIPEPSTWICLGLVGILGWRSRRTRNQT